MKKTVFLWMASLWCQTAFGDGLPELAARSNGSVVLLLVKDGSGGVRGSGTGFVVSKEGRVVTNDHVVHNASEMTAKLADGREVRVAALIKSDAANDLAVLQLAPGAYVPLEVGTSQGLQVGQEVVVVGSPLGLSTTVSTGIVSAIREKGLDPKELGDSGKVRPSWKLQITAAISPGSSGSPVMTVGGKVIGVAVGNMGGQALNFAIPIDLLTQLLASVKVEDAGKPLGEGELPRNLLISAVVFLFIGGGFFVIARKRS